MKSNIPVFLDTDVFLTHFSVTKLCQYSYPVSITIFLDNFENCFPWQCFHIHLDSKTSSSLAFLRESTRVKGTRGGTTAVLPATQQGNANKISSLPHSLKSRSRFLWQSTSTIRQGSLPSVHTKGPQLE